MHRPSKLQIMTLTCMVHAANQNSNIHSSFISLLDTIMRMITLQIRQGIHNKITNTTSQIC
uniref:Uncharacterized protein n=1 Tax=Rhizophora mucronata TaxID=61149 RepID=A0A2P2QR47_RHIMU